MYLLYQPKMKTNKENSMKRAIIFVLIAILVIAVAAISYIALQNYQLASHEKNCQTLANVITCKGKLSLTKIEELELEELAAKLESGCITGRRDRTKILANCLEKNVDKYCQATQLSDSETKAKIFAECKKE